ncbi:efflux transporter outer membrane subunit [Pseudoalteromonas lipolytica]|uniref:Efflux transporter outer membrane subunit n=1 Tax=Pseudoalteromonas lipolytica TaxID=570156 RepID=A0ABU8SZN6_9GAMM
MFNTLSKFTLNFSMIFLVSACSLAPDYQQPTKPIYQNWENSTKGIDTHQGETVGTLEWQSFVIDENLKVIVEIALENNRDLRQVLLNVEAVRAQYQIERADELPSFNISADASRHRQALNALELRGSSGPSNARYQNEYNAYIGMSAYEIDLFGRVRNMSEAGLQRYLASEQGAMSAQISLISEVIQAYLRRNGAQQRYALTQKILDAQELSLKLVEQSFKMGAVTELDYQEGLTLVQRMRVDLQKVQRELHRANIALMLLVGTDSSEIHLPDSPSYSALVVQDIGPGAPSDLLIHRPDIKAAEHQLIARNANIGAARAAFFPSVTLTGMYGGVSSEFSELFNSGQRGWNFGPQINLPIFDGGRNQANLDLAILRKDIAVAAYEETIQIAFKEVSDSLADVETLTREEVEQKRLQRATSRALELSEIRYQEGADNHLRLLDAQRNAFTSQIALLDVMTQRQLALASLFKTLGGGWQAPIVKAPSSLDRDI